jgi:hypothetical protein
MPSETKAMVGRIPVGNMRTIVVPPDRVWPVFEAILSQLEFGLAFMTPDDPTIFSVISFTPQSWRPTPTPAEFAVQVPVEDVPAWKEHRAFMITTTVSLNHVDVRELANSMRPILMDPNMQQVVPMGETNSLMISGRAAWVAEFVKSVQEINEFERVRHQNEAKEREAGTEATAQK